MSQPARILVLEDDDAMRELLTEILKDEGHQVLAVSRGQEAVEAAEREPLDLVILDVRMEGLDGLEALARMQEHLQGAASLVVTGYASEADSVRALRLGVSDYLRKPFDLTQFLQRVEGLLSETRRRRFRQTREERLRRLSTWALMALMRTLEGQGLPAGVVENLEQVGSLAGRLAEGAGMESPETEEVQAGTILLATRRLFALPAPALPCPGPPLALAAMCEEPGLASRVADLAVCAGQHSDPDERWPGRFDPILLAGLEAARAECSGRLPRAQALLGLAQTLLHAGDPHLAGQAFRRVLASGNPREKVAASLGLAEVALKAGCRPQLSEAVHSALQEARQVGPAETGRVALKGGILLMRVGDSEARILLEEAIRVARRLHLASALSRARLALLALGLLEPPDWKEDLELLLRPENQPERREDLPWLLPTLLETGTPPGSLARLIREAPGELARWLESGSPSASARRRVGSLLTEVGGCLPLDCLETLSADPDPEVRRQAAEALQNRSASPLRPVLRIQSLGPLEVFLGEDVIEERTWRSPRVKHLFAYLAVQPRPVPEERILEEFWPEDALRGRNALYWTTSALRRTLRGWSTSNQDPVQRVRARLFLNPELPRWHDLAEVERAAAIPQGPERPAAARRVLDLARGPFLEGCYMDWALQIRDRVDRWVRKALADLHRHHHHQGLEAEALECALRWKELDPLSQEACRGTMQSLLALSRPQEAIRHYEGHCRTLRRELDMDPPLELMELAQRARLGLS
jgi:two-component SAPR family response regulator